MERTERRAVHRRCFALFVKARRGVQLSDELTARRFSAMAEPHLDAAYNLARWLTRNPHDADDVVQEAYLRAFRFFDGFRGGDGRAWLLTIVRNTCYTWMKENRRGETQLEYDEADGSLQGEEAAELPLHNADPQSLLLRAADGERIEAALKRLPIEFREILVLRELEEMSYKDIAVIADLPIGTVMSRLSRARTQLRRILEKME
jgi:RNA polymerase sigma-70 factor, ECF subfamily